MSVNDLLGSAQIEFLISCNGIKDDNRKNGMRSELWMLVCKDEVKEAMVGGPIEPLERYGYWCTHLGAYDLKRFQNQLQTVYFDSYRIDYPDAPIVDEMDLTEIQRLIEYME